MRILVRCRNCGTFQPEVRLRYYFSPIGLGEVVVHGSAMPHSCACADTGETDGFESVNGCCGQVKVLFVRDVDGDDTVSLDHAPDWAYGEIDTSDIDWEFDSAEVICAHCQTVGSFDFVEVDEEVPLVLGEPVKKEHALYQQLASQVEGQVVATAAPGSSTEDLLRQLAELQAEVDRRRG